MARSTKNSQRDSEKIMKTKPEPLFIDGEVYSVSDYRNDPDIASACVSYAHGGLSPYEAEQLRDWLTKFLEWYYDEDVHAPVAKAWRKVEKNNETVQ